MPFPGLRGKTKHSIRAVTEQLEKLNSIPFCTSRFLLDTKKTWCDYHPWFTPPGARKNHNYNVEKAVLKSCRNVSKVLCVMSLPSENRYPK